MTVKTEPDESPTNACILLRFAPKMSRDVERNRFAEKDSDGESEKIFGKREES